MKRFVAATMIALALASGASAQTLQQRPQVQVTPVRPTIATANAGDIQAVRDENAQLRQELSELREAVRKFAVCQRALIARGASSGLRQHRRRYLRGTRQRAGAGLNPVARGVTDFVEHVEVLAPALGGDVERMIGVGDEMQPGAIAKAVDDGPEQIQFGQRVART
jgi:hypothetical protein